MMTLDGSYLRLFKNWILIGSPICRKRISLKSGVAGSHRVKDFRRHVRFRAGHRVHELVWKTKTIIFLGSGCGSVGRAVASNTRGPRFESSHRQKFINIEHLYTVNCVLKRRK